MRRAGSFYLEDSEDSELWKSERWKRMQGDPTVYVARLFHHGQAQRVVTNSSGLAQLPDEAPETQVEGGVPANCLKEPRDFLPEDFFQRAGTYRPEEAEAAAEKLLNKKHFEHDACLRLLEVTPWPSSGKFRALAKECYERYTHGGISGITSLSFQKPRLLKYLNAFMTHHGALGPRTSITINCGAHLAYHRDHNNLGMNYIYGLGEYHGGQIWIEDKDRRQICPGKWLQGRLHDIKERVLGFNPRAFHGPEPWTGRRWTITAYQTRSVKKLDGSRRVELRGLGFDTRGYLPPGRQGSSRLASMLGTIQHETVSRTMSVRKRPGSRELRCR